MALLSGVAVKEMPQIEAFRNQENKLTNQLTEL